MESDFDSIIYASEGGMPTTFLSVFCVMGTGQRDMLRNGREQFPEHADLKNGITGHHIFDLVKILVELQDDVLYLVIFIGKLYPFFHPVYEASSLPGRRSSGAGQPCRSQGLPPPPWEWKVSAGKFFKEL